MADMCPYCKPDTAGNHEWECPYNTKRWDVQAGVIRFDPTVANGQITLSFPDGFVGDADENARLRAELAAAQARADAAEARLWHVVSNKAAGASVHSADGQTWEQYANDLKICAA